VLTRFTKRYRAGFAPLRQTFDFTRLTKRYRAGFH
jgi:hypothetical protein